MLGGGGRRKEEGGRRRRREKEGGRRKEEAAGEGRRKAEGGGGGVRVVCECVCAWYRRPDERGVCVFGGAEKTAIRTQLRFKEIRVLGDPRGSCVSVVKLEQELGVRDRVCRESHGG